MHRAHTCLEQTFKEISLNVKQYEIQQNVRTHICLRIPSAAQKVIYIPLRLVLISITVKSLSHFTTCLLFRPDLC